MIRQIPKVLAGFVLGFLLMFTGSLVYSRVNQGRLSLEAGGPTQVAPRPPTQRAAKSDVAEVNPSHNALGSNEQDGSTGTSRNVPGPTSTLGDTHPATGVHSVAAEAPQPVEAPTRPLEPPHSNASSRVASTSSSYLDGEAQGADKGEPELLEAQRSIVPEPQLTPVREIPYPSPEVMTRPDTKPKTITVPAGTPLAIRLAEPLSSDRNRTGETFRAALASPLVVNGAVVAAEGSAVLGRIAQARRAPLLGGKSDLTLVLTNITESEGKLVSIDSNAFEEQGSRSNLLNTAKMATGAAVGAAIGAVTGAAEGAGISSSLRGGDRTNGFMATKRTIVVPAGTQITFSLASPLPVTLRGQPGSE